MKERKILKLGLTIASFIWYLYHVISKNDFTLIKIPTAFAVASLVYLLSSLYGFAVNVTRNYLLAAIASIATIFLLMKPLDVLSSWITSDILLVIIILVTIPLFIRDIRILFGHIEKSAREFKTSDETALNDDKTPSFQELVLKDPDLMMKFSQNYEKIKGCKPTYDELVDYIKNESFGIETSEEIEKTEGEKD